jgi:hypothetical protein
MYIQYVGFNVVTSSRIYTFRVIDMPKETREFTVKIQSETVRWISLKFQDGPRHLFCAVATRVGSRNKRDTRRAAPGDPRSGYPGIPRATLSAQKGAGTGIVEKSGGVRATP